MCPRAGSSSNSAYHQECPKEHVGILSIGTAAWELSVVTAEASRWFKQGDIIGTYV